MVEDCLPSLPFIIYLNTQKRPAKYVTTGMMHAESMAACESDIRPRSRRDIRTTLLSTKPNKETGKNRANELHQLRFERKVHRCWPVNEKIKAVRNAIRLASSVSVLNFSIKTHTILRVSSEIITD